MDKTLFTAEIKHIVALKSLKSQIGSFHKDSKKQSSLGHGTGFLTLIRNLI